jgi:hypothetical protein
MDTRKLRINTLKLRLSEFEAEALNKAVAINGGEKAVIAREIIMEAVEQILSEQNSTNKNQA